MSENVELQNELIGIPINYRVLPRTPSYYSNRALFYRGELGEVVMTFFEVIPPNVSENSEEALESLRNLGVNAESQVRIILPKELFLVFAQSVTQLAANLMSSQAPDKEL